MAKTVTVYRCQVCDSFSEELPDCKDCHSQSCQYNTGFSENPCILVKDITIDDNGKKISETTERPLYP